MYMPDRDTFGVEVGSDQINAAQVERSNKTVKLLKMAVGVLCLAVLGLLIGIIVVGVRHDSNGRLSQPALLSLSNDNQRGFENRGTVHAGSGTWVTKSSLEVATSDLSVVAIDSFAFLIGGNYRPQGNLTLPPEPTDAVWIYDTVSDTFTPGPSLPSASSRGAAAVSNTGTIYYAAGRAADGGIPDSCFFKLDSGAQAWTELPCMQTKRSDFCAASLDGKVYVFGGYTEDYQRLDSVEVFDPASGAWSTASLKLPSPRGDCMCTVLEDVVHVVGGSLADAPTVGSSSTPAFDLIPYGGFTKENVKFDFAAGTVTKMADALFARGDGVLVTVPSKFSPTMLYFGGETYSDRGAVQATQVGTHHVTMYVADVDAWIPKAPMSNARFRFAGAALNDTTSGDLSVVGFGGHTLCHDVDPSQPKSVDQCDEMASVEAFMDVDLPHIFMYTPSE